jgi:hypothetical protein
MVSIRQKLIHMVVNGGCENEWKEKDTKHMKKNNTHFLKRKRS